MVSLTYTFFALVAATLAVAHMELAWPTPLRSKLNPNTPWGQIGEFARHTMTLGTSFAACLLEPLACGPSVLQRYETELTRFRLLDDQSPGG